MTNEQIQTAAREKSGLQHYEEPRSEIRMAYCETCKREHGFGDDPVGCPVNLPGCRELRSMTLDKIDHILQRNTRLSWETRFKIANAILADIATYRAIAQPATEGRVSDDSRDGQCTCRGRGTHNVDPTGCPLHSRQAVALACARSYSQPADPGPQQVPASVPQIQAEQPAVGGQKAMQSWYVKGPDKSVVRNNGELIYSGPDDQMPVDARKIADEFTVNWGEQSAAQPAAAASDSSHVKLLGQALGNVLAKIGVIGSPALTGPELLCAADTFCSADTAASETKEEDFDELAEQCCRRIAAILINGGVNLTEKRWGPIHSAIAATAVHGGWRKSQGAASELEHRPWYPHQYETRGNCGCESCTKMELTTANQRIRDLEAQIAEGVKVIEGGPGVMLDSGHYIDMQDKSQLLPRYRVLNFIGHRVTDSGHRYIRVDDLFTTPPKGEAEGR